MTSKTVFLCASSFHVHAVYEEYPHQCAFLNSTHPAAEMEAGV